jgi:hypothetical protein
MSLRSILLILTLITTLNVVHAQSKTTEALQEKHSGALSLFFYHNTLRMINQTADPAFDELIKDIKKMKFLMIDKAGDRFDTDSYKKLVSDYKADAFEEIMTSRFQGKNFDIFLKGSEKKTEGMLVLVNDAESLYVLDIQGRINVNKVTELYNKLDGSSEIGQKIKAFANRDERSESRKKEKVENDN